MSASEGSPVPPSPLISRPGEHVRRRPLLSVGHAAAPLAAGGGAVGLRPRLPELARHRRTHELTPEVPAQHASPSPQQCSTELPHDHVEHLRVQSPDSEDGVSDSVLLHGPEPARVCSCLSRHGPCCLSAAGNRYRRSD
ncbi:hypothetical protein SDC9_103706 [bioreactor metagenome]|uniref:Uncharacterized protein n=1 Tax=bioreactor metagenome TaxID=1076179 RepID=A0A645AUW4_9ZZZZ